MDEKQISLLDLYVMVNKMADQIKRLEANQKSLELDVRCSGDDSLLTKVAVLASNFESFKRVTIEEYRKAKSRSTSLFIAFLTTFGAVMAAVIQGLMT